MPGSVTLIKTEDLECRHETDAFVTDGCGGSRFHDGYEIFFVVEGKGRFFVEGCTYSFSPGTVMLVLPDEYHSLMPDKVPCFDRFTLRFRDNLISSEMRDLLRSLCASDGERGSRLSPSLHVIEPLIGAFSRFADADILPAEKRELYAKTVLSEIIVLLSSAVPDRRSADSGELAVRILDFLNERPGQNLSLDEIAKHFFVSKYYLCRTFKAYNGISIHEYLLHKRVLLAKKLMESGETAAAAAYRVGFSDYSAFYRAFVKVTGTSPVSSVRKKGKSHGSVK